MDSQRYTSPGGLRIKDSQRYTSPGGLQNMDSQRYTVWRVQYIMDTSEITSSWRVTVYKDSQIYTSPEGTLIMDSPEIHQSWRLQYIMDSQRYTVRRLQIHQILEGLQYIRIVRDTPVRGGVKDIMDSQSYTSPGGFTRYTSPGGLRTKGIVSRETPVLEGYSIIMDSQRYDYTSSWRVTVIMDSQKIQIPQSGGL
ncbi:unnamed protein product [Coregonus sp. 'balchen']|nr:unnamed protein product [Coregonus sp. 'balchen']